MKEKLTIALVAHDNRKADMVDWARYNAEYLSHHRIVCTGTTGGLIKMHSMNLALKPTSAV